MGYQQHLDLGPEFNVDDESMHPPTDEEQAQMLEHLSVMHAISLLRERGYAVVEPVEIDDGSASCS